MESDFSSESNLCPVCFESMATTILTPCQHELCWSCAQTLATDARYRAAGKCPCCRSRISSICDATTGESLERRLSSVASSESSRAQRRTIRPSKIPRSSVPILCCLCYSRMRSENRRNFRLICRPRLQQQVLWMCRKTPCGHGVCERCWSSLKAQLPTVASAKMREKLEIVFGGGNAGNPSSERGLAANDSMASRAPLGRESLSAPVLDCFVVTGKRSRHVLQCPICRQRLLFIEEVPRELVLRVLNGQARINNLGQYV